MELHVRQPDVGYMDSMLWVPKTAVNVEGVKRALTFQFFEAQRVVLLTLYKETEHHLLVPREFWDPKDFAFPVVDCRPRRYERVDIRSRIRLDHRFEGGKHVATGDTVQQEAMNALLLARGGILQLACGKGKAQPLATRILTPDGWRAIGSLKEWDEVIGSDGKATKVLGVYPQGRLPVFRVTMEDSTSTRCCGTHLWFTQTPGDRRRGEAGRVRTTDEIRRTLRSKAGAQHSTQRVPAVHFRKQPSVYAPWLVGMYLGDGSSGVYRGSRRIQFDKGNTALHTRIAEELQKYGDGSACRKDPDSKNWTTFVKFDVRKEGACWRFLKENGLVGVGSLEKFVPHQYLSASVEERWQLLEGLLASDGSVLTTARSFGTSSPRMREAVTELARSLGVRVTVEDRQTFFTHHGQKKAGAPSWRLYLSHDKWGHGRYNNRQYIQSIEPAGTEACVCIQVAANDSLYVTENFLLTHNTVVALDFIARRGVPAIIILDTTQLMKQWAEEIALFLDVPGGVGLIQGDVFDWKKPIVLATYHSLAARALSMSEEVRRWFGTAVWDEAHHVAAPMFSRSADLFYGMRLGLTATPSRDDGMHVVYDFHLGQVIYKNLLQELKPRIYFIWTGFGIDKDDPRVLAAVNDKNGELHIGKVAGFLGGWRPRIDFVLNQVREAIAAGRKVIVLSKSVDSLINMHAVWNGQRDLISDIPFPLASEVGETVPPNELTELELKKLNKQLHVTIGNIQKKPDNLPHELQRKAHIEQLLQGHLVFKKCMSLWNKKRGDYLKALLKQSSTAGLMIYKVDADTRTRLLREKQVTFAIAKYGREGLNERSLDTIIVNEPLSSRNSLQQLLGRVLRRKDGKKEPVAVFLEDDIGPFIGMCKKLRRHLTEWSHDEGGPLEYENLGHTTSRKRDPSWKTSDSTTFMNRTSTLRGPGSK